MLKVKNICGWSLATDSWVRAWACTAAGSRVDAGIRSRLGGGRGWWSAFGRFAWRHFPGTTASPDDILDVDGDCKETLDLAKNLHVLRNQVDGDGVLSSPRNDHIRIFFCRQAELFKGRLHQGSVLGRWNDNLSCLLFFGCVVLYQGLFRLLQGFLSFASRILPVEEHAQGPFPGPWCPS